MNRFQTILLGLIAAAGAAWSQLNLDFLDRLGSDVKIKADQTNYDNEKGLVHWKGNVFIKLQTTEIYCDQADFDTKIEEIHTSGHVSIYREGILYRGEAMNYSVRNHEVTGDHLRSMFEPIFFATDDFKSKTEEISVVNGAATTFSTDDAPDPDWFIKAKEIRIYPGDRVVFINPTAYVGKVPVFWLPYLSQPLQEQLGYTFTPGYRSEWGGFLLNRYGTMWGDHSIVQFDLDFRASRGVAGGINVLSRRWKDSPNFGKFQFYYANDTDPQQTGAASHHEDRSGLDSNRYRVNLHHRIYLPGPQESTLYVDFNINKLSDNFFYEDFFPSEFRLDPQPDNFITLTKQHERGELNLMTRFRANDFYTTDTRLPELAVDFTRQPIFNTGLFYWGNTSFGIYEEKIPGTELEQYKLQISDLEQQLGGGSPSSATSVAGQTPISAILDPQARQTDQTMLDSLRSRVQPRGFTRLYSYHEVLYPMNNVGGFLNIVPKIGGGFANYSSVDGDAPNHSTRGIFHAGVDVSMKTSKMYDNVKIESLGVDGLLHVVQPYINYSYVSASSLGTQFGGIDRLVPSTRLRPLDVPQFTAIDSLQNWNVVRVGVENRLLTRRANGTHPWLTSNTYFDGFIDDPEFHRDYSNLFEDLAWYPLPWLKFDFNGQFPVFGGGMDFTELNTSVTFMPTSNFEFRISNRYLQKDPFFADSNLVDFTTYVRLSDNWGFSTFHRYEFADSTLESQSYSVHRDLTSWVAALGFVSRDNRGKKDSGLVFSLTLKDFPSVSIPLDIAAGGLGGSGVGH